MYDLLSLLSGALLAVMITANGALGGQFGVYRAALYIHIVGACFALAALAFKRKLPLPRLRLPLWMYTGGVIGVFTTVFCNIAASGMGVTGIVALELAAQLVFSFFIDRFGWFGAGKSAPGAAGLLLPLCGAALMLTGLRGGEALFALVSLGAGVTAVLSRTVNARLAQHTGALEGSLINHLAGLPLCLIAALFARESTAFSGFHPLYWCGGVLGVCSVALLNITVPRVSACRMTLLSFCGQLFCGAALDVLLRGAADPCQLAAGVLVAAGAAVGGIKRPRRSSGKE